MIVSKYLVVQLKNGEFACLKKGNVVLSLQCAIVLYMYTTGDENQKGFYNSKVHRLAN